MAFVPRYTPKNKIHLKKWKINFYLFRVVGPFWSRPWRILVPMSPSYPFYLQGAKCTLLRSFYLNARTLDVHRQWKFKQNFIIWPWKQNQMCYKPAMEVNIIIIILNIKPPPIKCWEKSFIERDFNWPPRSPELTTLYL